MDTRRRIGAPYLLSRYIGASLKVQSEGKWMMNDGAMK